MLSPASQFLAPHLSMEAALRRLPPMSTRRGLLFHPVPLRERVTQKVPRKGAASCHCSCLFSNDLSRRREQRLRKLLLCPDGRHGRGRRAGREVVVGAKKKKKSSKSDKDGFLPDENEFFFPEAVFLKKKTVEEDGKVLPDFADAEEEKLFEFPQSAARERFKYGKNGVIRLNINSGLLLHTANKDVRHYEVVYLIHEDHLHEVDTVISKVQDFIREKRGKIWRLNNWGLRRLAYKIKKAKKAIYLLMNFELDAKCINDFKSMLDKEERIIRHLVIKRDEAITEDCPPPPEFHTLRADGIDEEGDEEHYDGEQGWDDEIESEMVDYDDDEDDDFGDNIIVVDDEDDDFGDSIIVVDDDDEDDNVVSHKDAKRLNAKQRVKALP